MVTGAPAKLLDRREQLTPMLSQYVELAETYDDAILLFRVGDFYKAFCAAADEVARICELTRIEREDSTGTYTACGIPVESAASYLDRLLAAGHRLAVADQVEDPAETTGLVDRAVTRIVTPGTVLDDDLLESAGANYLGCVARPSGDTSAGDDTDAPGDGTLGFGHVDVSTGECAVTSGSRAAIRAELARIDPAELVVGPAVGEETLQSRAQLDASPKVYSICDWERLAAKPMPQVFPEGMALQYELRSCPVVRKASSGRGKNQNGDTRSWEEGDELDAFLAEAWNRPDEDLSREQVYRDWLRRQFEIRGGAEPQSIGMERFSIERMTRRVSKGGDGKRKAHTIKRPDVTLTGALKVTGSEAFSELLRSGLGRHKSFGYGMLKVQRA